MTDEGILAEAPPPEAGWAADVEERPLDGRIVPLWRLALLARAATWTLGAVALELVGRWQQVPWLWIAAALALAGGLAVAGWPPLQFRAWRFRMRERDLLVRSGVLWRTVSVIPYSRIQHVDTRSGPLERGFGLASVVVYTAGVRGADATIPGLAAADAEALRERLASLGGAEDAV